MIETLPTEALHGLQSLLSRAVQEGVAPGASLRFGAYQAERGRWVEGAVYEGRHSYEPSAAWVGPESVYDLASLTKPLACAWWAWRLWSDAQLDLNMSVGEALKGAARVEDELIAKVPVWRLLNHSSGLPAHRAYYEGLGAERMAGGSPAEMKRWVRRVIARTTSEYLPGSEGLYSDLGFLLLEWICELHAGEELQSMWERERPIPGLHFNPLTRLERPEQPASLALPSERYAPTERCPWRGRTLVGEVHDDNAWLCGGVCGHAGLFGSASALSAWGRAFIDAYHGRESSIALSEATLRHISDLKRRPPNRGSFVLGLDTPSSGYSSAGVKLSRRAVGHLGFTGTSLWMDLEAQRVIALLTNRVHPDRERGSSAIRWLRPTAHDQVWALCEELGL